jgi:hypothetical protein
MAEMFQRASELRPAIHPTNQAMPFDTGTDAVECILPISLGSRGESPEPDAKPDLPLRSRVAANQSNLTKKPTPTFLRPILARLLLTTSLVGAPWFALAQNAQSDSCSASRRNRTRPENAPAFPGQGRGEPSEPTGHPRV